ncbi:hypothetical protein BDV59DRAFT_105443 [Aspergillus ambiguus]|uniref:uncharacterized protein n=1 Tax=Aspergillus ambiguus TaxID=176160 RepID=UPI003CCE3467
MGIPLSIQSRDKRRRSNRLSKPPCNIATLSSAVNGGSPPLVSSANSPASSNSVDWQNPWTGASVSITSPGTESSGRRSQSFPSASVHPEGPWVTTRVGRSQSIVREKVDRSPTSTSSASGSLSQRASFQPSKHATFQPTTLWSEPPSPLGRPGPPKRSYSVQSPPRRTSAAIYGATIEDATSSNTHFMVDSQGFSLIRRRSLLTRPGIATRRSTRNVVPRLPSPIDQEAGFTSTETVPPSRTPHWPLPECDDPPPLSQFRPPTPGDFGYTHLGALKLGSLRVVNCSTSPCPSDRTRLNQTRSPSPVHAERRSYGSENWPFNGEFQSLDGHIRSSESSDGFELINHGSPDDLDVMTLATECPSDQSGSHYGTASMPADRHQPTLEGNKDRLSAGGLLGEQSDIVIPQRQSSKATDEGISVLDEDRGLTSQVGGSTKGNPNHWPARSHKKVDSGYSSAASVRSLQDARARISIDSQASAQFARSRRFTLSTDSGKLDLSRMKPSADLGSQLPLNRHLSLHGSRVTPRPDPNDWLTSLSTMCLEPSQIPADRHSRSLSSSAPQSPSRAQSLSRYCAQLRTIETESVTPLPSVQPAESLKGFGPEKSVYRSPSSSRLPTNYSDNAILDLVRATNGSTQSGEEESFGTAGKGKTRKAVGLRKQKSFSRPARTGTVASEGVDMTHLGHDSPRGRAKSRDADYPRHRLSKPQKRPNIYTASSPFIFH